MPLNRNVVGYHRGLRTKPPNHVMAYGIELELEGVRSRKDVVNAFPERRPGDHPQPAFEVDASLTAKGVEVIFPPIRTKQIRNPESYINRAVKALRDGGVTRHSDRAGMHININMRYLPAHTKYLVAAVVHRMPRSALEAIGGRRLNGYCAQHLALFYTDHTLAAAGYRMSGHASAANPCEDRLEMRYPVGSLDPEHWQRNLDFIEVLLRFAKHKDGKRVEIVGQVWPAFHKWLMRQEKEDARRIKEIVLAHTA